MTKRISGSKKRSISRKLKKAGAISARLHVVPRTKAGSWAIKREGASKARAIVSGKTTAIGEAKKMAKAGQIKDIVVHSKDGTITDSIVITETIKAKISPKKTKKSSKRIVGAKK
jgi:hypothetical protein